MSMENNSQASRFFLGANSPGGFASLYQGFTREGEHLYILKGGPGCGKSTMMKSIGAAAHEAGLFVEYIHCSGDPDSLDGVRVPERGLAWVDGTSPHVVEPVFAGSQASYVNMGAFYDLAELSKRREEIAALTASYKNHYKRAFGLIASAAAVPGADLPEELTAAAVRRVRSLMSRQLRSRGDGRVTRRFLSAFTCRGYMCLWDTVSALADRVIVLDNGLGLAVPALEEAASAALSRGIGVIRCQSPMFPDITEHIILPDIGLALVTQTPGRPCPLPAYRHLRLDQPSGFDVSGLRAQAKRLGRLRGAALEEAYTELAAAKSDHDLLEACYIPNVDFPGIDRLTGRHIEALLE